MTVRYAPGWPGIPARWTSSAKSGVGTALSHASQIWFTISHGILNEVYYPRVDQACVRDLGLIITAGRGYFSEEKRHAQHQVSYLEQGCPAYHIVSTCKQERYRIEKEILADPARPVVLQQVRFAPMQGVLDDYHLYALLAPHLENHGAGNTAWVGDHKGMPMLFAERDATSLALACSVPWLKRSVGFVGFSDGWQELTHHDQMTCYERAENGNVAAAGEIDLQASDGTFVLALAFGRTAVEAGHRALASLLDGFENLRQAYIKEWVQWQGTLRPIPEQGDSGHDLYHTSTAVIRIHEAKHLPGGIIASLSIPWGEAKGDDDLGGYHLIWVRDLAEAAGGLLAAGGMEDARRVLRYLQVTQESDGHWPQNMWVDGAAYWGGLQMDETAFPILLVDLARRGGELETDELAALWPMLRKAASFLLVNGPVTQQDRWEEDPGYSPFTLAVEIAALLAAADLAELHHEPQVAAYLRETADIWNANVEQWTYVRGTSLAQKIGVDGYYVRIAPPDVADASSPLGGFVPIKNRPPGESDEPSDLIISPDALALVRFGLRAANDPRILDTVKAIDVLLKVDTPFGPAWHRYDDDGYGEHADGTPFDGTGIGRAWPLLTGERAHYELAAGRHDEATQLLHTLEAFANEGGLLSEQIWDTDDIPESGLLRGRPSGSAMPLVWAHAEYVKLRRSLQDGAVFDMPPQTVQRYQVEKTGSSYDSWRFNQKSRTFAAGKTLRLEVQAPAVVHWSADAWHTTHDARSRDTGLGMHVVDLPTDQLPVGATVVFTFYWPEADRWEGTNFEIAVGRAADPS